MQKKVLSYNAEIKAVGDSDKDVGEFEGYGSVFDVVDSYSEVVDRGAFVESLKKKMPVLLIQHSSWMVGGIYVEAHEDQKGLYLKGQLNLKVQHARETYELLKQGALKGMSIGFRPQISEYNRDTGITHLKRVNLMEVSIVTFPANEAAEISSVKSAPATIRSFEDCLRDAGFSRADAEFIGQHGFRSYEARRDGGDLSAVVAGLEGLKKQLMKSPHNVSGGNQKG